MDAVLNELHPFFVVCLLFLIENFHKLLGDSVDPLPKLRHILRVLLHLRIGLLRLGGMLLRHQPA